MFLVVADIEVKEESRLPVVTKNKRDMATGTKCATLHKLSALV